MRGVGVTTIGRLQYEQHGLIADTVAIEVTFSELPRFNVLIRLIEDESLPSQCFIDNALIRGSY